jgi:beta-lactamase class A
MHRIKNWMKQHKKQLLIAGAGAALLMVVVQIIYPSSQLLPLAKIDNLALGGISKTDAISKLDKDFAQQSISLVLNNDQKATTNFKPADIGLAVHNNTRVNNYDYPLLWRLIPTSLFWYQPLQFTQKPSYERSEDKVLQFVDKQFGKTCVIKPQNATIEVKVESLKVVSAKDGGTCSKEDVISRLQNLEITIDRPSTVRISVDVVKPDVSTDAAKELAQTIENHTSATISIAVKDNAVKITKKQLYGWLAFTVKNKKLTPLLDEKKAKPFLDKSIAPAVTIPAGKTVVTTQDFTVLSTQKGAPGMGLDVDKTLSSVLNVMQGKEEKSMAVTKVLQPSITYKRSYTKTSTGIAAMLQHYDEDHPGTFGVSFTELGGRGLSAQHDSTKSFITASTYKLFVAYDTLRKVEKGDWEWSDQVVGGRNLATCFDDMIVKSDNACAEALYKKIGYQKVIDDVRKLGLSHTFLGSSGQETTSGDLALFLNKLYSGSIDLKISSRDRLISAMKRNVYRSGIPAGTSGTVANKVGFLNGLFHDASIVYSSKGNYVLVIMSDGSSWANIAEITKKIESLR